MFHVAISRWREFKVIRLLYEVNDMRFAMTAHRRPSVHFILLICVVAQAHVFATTAALCNYFLRVRLLILLACLVCYFT